MEYIISNVKNLVINKSTLDYMNNTKLEKCPEDVYFSKAMLDFNLGRVATFEKAKQFSMETQYYDNSLGGHNFWLGDNKWINKFKSIVPHF